MLASAAPFAAPFGAGPAIVFAAISFHAVITAGLAAAGACAPPEAGSAAIKPTLTTSANITRLLIVPSLPTPCGLARRAIMRRGARSCQWQLRRRGGRPKPWPNERLGSRSVGGERPG